ncbi:MAG: DUF2961 domain-containing protein [Planctomycetes bacterium]|nr:DUF2961 domain-containing protein [Planctomycetota bacterium]
MGRNRALPMSLAVALACVFAQGGEAAKIPVGLEVLSSLELLPLLKEGIVCRQQSSHDRTGGELALGWAVDLKKGRVPENAAYLHVQWRNHMTRAGEYVPLLEATGRGHYVGTGLSMQSPHWLTYLEGDEQFYVDGEERPSIHGTGTEDYFNCGWYYKDGPVSRPFHGLTAMPDYQSRTSQYRMHVPDCVPFTKSLKVQIEHGEANDRPYTNYAIVAYWYQDSTSHEVRWKLPPAKDLRFPGLLANNPGMGTFRAEEKWTAFVDLVPK